MHRSTKFAKFLTMGLDGAAGKSSNISYSLKYTYRVRMTRNFKQNSILSDVVKVVPRIVNLPLSILFISLLARILSVKDFAHLQMSYAVSGIALWIVDFGAINVLLIHKSNNENQKVREIWTKRNIHLLAACIIILTIGFSVHKFLFFTILLVCALLDLNSDTLMSLRQIIMSPRKAAVIQFLKKFTQILMISILLMLRAKPNPFYILAILAIPSVLTFFFDNRSIGGLVKIGPKALKISAWSMWLQNGGTMLAGLDIFIINLRGANKYLVIFILAKRISNTLGIFGNVLATESIYRSANYSRIHDLIALKKSINYVTKIIFVVSITLALSSPFFLKQLLGRSVDFSEYLIVIGVLCVTPVGILAASANGFLIGRNYIKSASIATYSSSICYLTWLFFASMIIDFRYVLALGIPINLIFEYVVSSYFVRSKVKNIEMGTH